MPTHGTFASDSYSVRDEVGDARVEPAVRIHADVARADLSSRAEDALRLLAHLHQEISRSAPAIAITTVGTGRFHPDRSSSSCLSPSTKSGDESAARTPTATARAASRRSDRAADRRLAARPAEPRERPERRAAERKQVRRRRLARCSESRRICFWCAISAADGLALSWIDLRRSFRRTGDGAPKPPNFRLVARRAASVAISSLECYQISRAKRVFGGFA